MILETPLLTVEQRKRLIARDEKKESELEAYKKRHNDQVVLKKFGDYIESIPDILLIMKHMPPEKITKKLQLAQIPPMLDMIDVVLQKINPWPVVERDGDVPLVYMTMGERIKDRPGECTVESMAWTATAEEIAINRRLKDHIEALQYFIDPYLINPICLEPREQIVPAEDALKAIRSQTRREFTINTYFKGIRGADGLNYPQHITVKEDDLKFKRWNPKGIPRKYDVPEQPEEPPSSSDTGAGA